MSCVNEVSEASSEARKEESVSIGSLCIVNTRTKGKDEKRGKEKEKEREKKMPK